MLNVPKYLEDRSSGLAKVTVKAEGRFLRASEWIMEIATRFRIKPEWILTVLQKEQSLVTEKKVLPAEYSLERWDAGPPAGWKYPDPNIVAYRFVRTAGGWYRVYGVWRMVASCGAGIPEIGWTPPWDMKDFLGFDKQVYTVGRLAGRDLDKYQRAISENRPELRSVTLNPTPEQLADAKAKGKTPVGTTVVVKDPASFVALTWSPSEKMLAETIDANKKLGFS